LCKRKADAVFPFIKGTQVGDLYQEKNGRVLRRKRVTSTSSRPASHLRARSTQAPTDNGPPNVITSVAENNIPEGFGGLVGALVEPVSQVDIDDECEREAESHSIDWRAGIQHGSDAAFENVVDEVDAYSQVVTDATDRAYKGFVFQNMPLYFHLHCFYKGI